MEDVVHKLERNPELQEIRADLDALKTNVVSLAHNIKHGGGTVARQGFESLKDAGKEEIEKVGHYVQEKPVQSIALAFCAGLVFSALLSRH